MFSKKLEIVVATSLLIGVLLGFISSDAIKGTDEKISRMEKQLAYLNNTIASSVRDLDNLVLENIELKEELDMQGEQYNSLLDSYQILSSEFTELESKYNQLLDEMLEVNQSYRMLLENLDIIETKEHIQNVEYNISAGTYKTWIFYIAEHGITWESEISFSGTYISMSHIWQKGEERMFVGSLGTSLTITDSPDIPYYGYQQWLWGNVTIDWSNDLHDPNIIWISGRISSNLPTISKEVYTYIDISQ